MAVICSHCGEELMGAVNRCWRCGETLVAHSGPQDVPPIRRDPITGPLDTPLEATVLTDSTAPAVRAEPRRGSPFAANSTTLRVAGPIHKPIQTESPRPRTPRTFESQFASQFAAVIALVLGIAALGVSIAVPIAAVCLALFVIGFGIWGLFGRRRGVAIFGLIIGCVALAWGGFGTAVQVYELIYGIHPFATAPQLPPVQPNQ